MGYTTHASMPCLDRMVQIACRLVVEGHYLEPPDDGYPVVTQSGLIQNKDSHEEAWSPSRRLEVARLQKDIADYRKKMKVRSVQSTAIPSQPTKRSGFTITPVPRFSGQSRWEQYRQVFEAIVRSNGWDDVTSAQQLLSHLDGDALNIALLVPEVPAGVSGSFSEIVVGSPGRLAEHKRQFERTFRRPGDDPSVFAIELETLARRAFVDIDSSVPLQMVRDRFIDGQAECALRRHLDSLGPDTPMRDIVDSCRVWESHIEVASSRQVRLDRHSPCAVCQVTEDSQSPAAMTGSETLEEIM